MSERLEFVFLHNPKCAGTSVRQALLRFETTDNFFWRYDEWHGRKIDKAHLPLFILRSRFPQYFYLIERYFSFIFVRNPYARAVSAFNEINQDLFRAAHGSDTASVEKIAAWRKGLNDFIVGMNVNSIKGWDIRYRHFVRQIDLVYLGTKSYVDLVMKLEDWPACLRALGVFQPEVAQAIQDAPRRHVRSLKDPPENYLGRQAMKRINSLYSADFEVLGYNMLE